jgi:2,3-bisphosphoglycerate-dependent phosphoglycerate mutase
MITNIYFVRHAHSIYTSDELNRPLSDKGLTAANRVTELLKNEDINYVIASPYRRAIQTVEGVAANNSMDIIIEEDFKERKLSEQSVDDFDSAVLKLWTDFSFAFPGGESSLKAQTRGVSTLNRILNKYSGSNIVLGTHGNIMVLIMNYYDRNCDYNFWRNLDMPDVYKLSFEGYTLLNIQRLWK